MIDGRSPPQYRRLAQPSAVALVADRLEARGRVSGTVWSTAMQQRIPAAMLSRLIAVSLTGSFGFAGFG